MIEVLGVVAGLFTGTGCYAQLYKVYKTKSIGDLSLITYGSVTFGTILWLIYGVAVGAFAIIVMNTISLVPLVIITYLLMRELWN